MLNEHDIQQFVENELATVVDAARRKELQRWLIPPERIRLNWGYGKPGDQHECWVVARSSGQRILYCEQGFGPDYSWGIVGTSENWMGMDCQWHVGLEHAAIGAGILSAPLDYEVP